MKEHHYTPRDIKKIIEKYYEQNGTNKFDLQKIDSWRDTLYQN